MENSAPVALGTALQPELFNPTADLKNSHRKLRGSLSGHGGLRLVAAFAILVSVVYVLDVPFRDMWSQNEARYALGAASVLRGQWLVPTIADTIDADKPPLFFWFVAAVSAPFGDVSDWTARLANLLAALVALGAIFHFGRITRNRWVGFLSAALLATTYEFWQQVTRPGVDILLTAMLTVTWIALYRMLAEGFSWRRWAALWGFMGLAFLTKGPLALILSGLTAVVFAGWQFGWREGWRRLLRLRPFTGALLACAPFVLWAELVYAFLGAEPLRVTVIKHNFVRFFEAFDHAQPWYYLICEMPIVTLPWSLLLPFALWYGWRARRARGEPRHRPVMFSASGMLVVIGFFSLSSSKQDYYLLPLIPWFAYAMSVFIWDRFAAAAPVGDGARWSEREFLDRFLRTPVGRMTAGIFACMLLGILAYSTIAASVVDKRKSPRPVANAINQAVDENDHLVFIHCENLLIFFYLERPYELWDDTPDDLARVREMMENGRKLDIVIERDDRHHLARFDGIPLYVEGRQVLRRKTYYILTNEAKPGLERLLVEAGTRPARASRG